MGKRSVRGGVCALVLAAGALALRAEAGMPAGAAWLDRLNRERARRETPPLALSPLLAEAAQEQAEAMAASAAMGATAARTGGPRLRSPSAAEVTALLARVGYGSDDWREAYLLSTDDPTGDRERLRGALVPSYREMGVGTAFGEGYVLQVFLFAVRTRDRFATLAAPLADRARVEDELLAGINSVRRRSGIPPLARNPRLDRAAQVHADDMLSRSYFGHRTPEGLGPTDRARAEGYGAAAAENLVEGRYSAEEALRAWLDSAPHRRNLLDPDCREAGLGLGVGAPAEPGPGAGRVVWVLSLGGGEGRSPQDPEGTEIEVTRVDVRYGRH